jgi:hypothetical protein
MDEHWKYMVTKRTNATWFNLYDILKISKFIEVGGRLMVSSIWREDRMKYKFSVRGGKIIVEWDHRLYNFVNILKTSHFHSLTWYSLWYRNYISVERGSTEQAVLPLVILCPQDPSTWPQKSFRVQDVPGKMLFLLLPTFTSQFLISPKSHLIKHFGKTRVGAIVWMVEYNW